MLLKSKHITHRPHALRGDAACDAPASRDAGASMYEFPRRPWELSFLGDIEDADIINLTPEVLKKTTELLENNTLRSLDAMHIACALDWQAELFVSSDERQVSAAQASGLKVEFIEGFNA